MPAVSKAQQRFMGMVHAAQKGDMENPSPEVEKAADSMSDKDAKDYASTSHKGLPDKKENMITRNRLKEIVKEVMVEEADYQTFFKKALEKAGKGINDMSDDEKKAFFNKIDAAWNGKGEKNEELTGGQHKLDVDKDGDIEADDLADLRAGKKVDEAVDFKDGKYRFYSKDGVGYLTYAGKELASGDFDWEDGSNSYWMSHSSFKGSQRAFDTGKDVINYFKSKKITTENISTELPKATIPSAVKQKMAMAIDKIKDAKLSNVQKLQLVAQVVDSLGIDKSQLGSMASKIRSKMESVSEGVSSAEMDKIKGAVEAAKSFMSVGAELKKLGMKYTFATEPLPIYIIQPTPNNRVAIVNKKYVSKPDFVVGDIAVGVMEGKSVNEGLWPKSKLPQSFQFALAPELKKNFKGIFYSIGDDIYHNDKKVLSVDGDRDSVNSIIAKLKKIVK
jgi:hypothetical protein